jgi:multiple sugar transport system substrate-binding protein
VTQTGTDNRTTTAGTSRRYRLIGVGVAGFALGMITLLLLTSLRAAVFPPQPLEPGELVILTGADDSIGGQRQQLIQQWNSAYPGSPARLVTASDDADKQHSAMVNAAQTPGSDVDIYNLDVTWIAEFASAHYILPLDSKTDGFLERPLQTCRIGDTLWALPFNTDAGLLFYRPDLGLSRTTLPRQIPPTNTDVRRMTAADPKLTAGYVGQFDTYEGLTVNALEIIWGSGGDVVNGDRVVIDSAAAIGALQRLALGLDRSAGLPPAVLPDSRGYKEKQSTEAFRAGTVGLMRNWPVAYGQLTRKSEQPSGGFDISTHFAVTRLPGDTVLGGQNLAIASSTTPPRAAKKLIEFLTSAESERQLFHEGRLAPTRDTAYVGAPDQEFADTLLAAVRNARPRPMTANYPLFSSVFQEIVKETLNRKGILPENAVSRLTDALNGRLR